MKEQNQESETITISKKIYDKMAFHQYLLNALLRFGVDKWEGWDKAKEELLKREDLDEIRDELDKKIILEEWDEIADDRLEVGLRVGVKIGNVLEEGEIISLYDDLVRVRHDNNSVSAYQLGCFKFLEMFRPVRNE